MKLRISAVVGVLVALAAVSTAVAAKPSAPQRSAGTISGAGATFPAPLIAVWQREYKRDQVNYNAIGSGGGISAITNRTVDFGASDAPLTKDQFAACKGCVQMPWVLSATSIMYNLDGVKNAIHMNGRLIADIYLGNVTNWNDARIRRLNPGVNFPDRRITPVYRSDGSGTTYNFTDYLTKVSPSFKSRVGGPNTTVNWPAGVGARGSSGVAGVVTRTEGAVGYADIAYALQNHIKFAAVQNRSGIFATPGLRSIKAASLADVKFSSTNELSIVNPPKGKKFRRAYPISTYSYVILPLQSSKAAQLKSFVTWAVTSGQRFGPKLIFQPVPPYVVTRVKAQLRRVR
ncbi:MAG TPA: phosphate ABC transporter substrate-binding protein PstS [Gaiellaceae bacterium]|nr:phosphate ABC transporter substrate-binding protein PstS [Gaiellaceae bacterium]